MPHSAFETLLVSGVTSTDDRVIVIAFNIPMAHHLAVDPDAITALLGCGNPDGEEGPRGFTGSL